MHAVLANQIADILHFNDNHITITITIITITLMKNNTSNNNRNISIRYHTVLSTIGAIFFEFLIFCRVFRRVKQQQRMKNEENIYHIVQGKGVITILSLTYKISKITIITVTIIIFIINIVVVIAILLLLSQLLLPSLL